MKPEQGSDFCNYLKREFVARTKKNPSYSLRSFASFLGIHHAALSLILNRKRKLSPKMIKRLATKLDINPDHTMGFIIESYASDLSTPKPHSHNKLKIVNHDPSDFNFRSLASDEFERISERVHDALIELTHLKKFRLDPKLSKPAKLAKILKVPLAEIHGVIERLLRLNYLKKNDVGRLVDALGNSSNLLSPTYLTGAARRYQKESLQKSLEALEQTHPPDREHTSLMMAISKKDLPTASRIIQKCRKDLFSLMQEDQGQYDSVYQFCFSYFPVILDSEITPYKKGNK